MMRTTVIRALLVPLSVVALSLCAVDAVAQSVMPRIKVSGSRFVVAGSGEVFTPWGFNYDRDWRYRLLEDYWADEWSKVEEDFGELHALGANVVRICLQYHRFMDGPSSPNETNLARLRQLVMLAESHGIYLDIVGLASFRPGDDPAWYVDLSERERWALQAAFWATIAETLADRPGVFAFNLMNEPVVAGQRLERGEWVHPVEIEGLHYVEFINLDSVGRDRSDIAVAWIRQMTRAIRAHDSQTLITVGLFPLLGSAAGSGFAPSRIAAEVDYISVHLYPEAGRVDAALKRLEAYDVGLPLVIEEVFPLNGGVDDFRTFLHGSRKTADGWLTFYWGEPVETLRERDEPLARLVVGAMEAFEELKP